MLSYGDCEFELRVAFGQERSHLGQKSPTFCFPDLLQTLLFGSPEFTEKEL